MISENHVEAVSLDNNFCQRVCRNLIEALDPEKLYLTQNEIYRLVAHQGKIVEDLKNNTWTFFPLLKEVYHTALLRAEKSLIASAKLKPDLSFVEVINDTTWAADEPALQLRLNAAMKQDILERIFGATKDPGIEHKAVASVQAAMLRNVQKILNASNGFDQYLSNVFLQSFTKSFDPHSQYLSSVEMQNFIASLSSQGFEFGFILDEDLQGNVKIDGIVPGSPAWECGEIHTGDIIEALAWHGKEKADITLLGIDEVESILMESNHDVLEIFLRSVDGTEKKVLLKKEFQDTEDRIVKSTMLAGAAKVGYISLPDFYSNWEVAGGSECANDVAKEIVKLKREGINGLILDLRFNGGGSLAEAVALAGIFVDAGPIGLLKSKTGEVVTHKDVNRGTIWDGPLIILVNGLSASASEFVAAALQDYNRALIVGARTYGKGTAQNMFSTQPGKSAIDFKNVGNANFGYTTITTNRSYRITGKTVQYTGVTPDIILPDPFFFALEQERSLNFALRPDEAFKKVYYQPLKPINLNQLSELSSKRTSENEYFVGILKMNSTLTAEKQRSGINKKYSRAEFETHLQQIQDELTHWSDTQKPLVTCYEVQFLPADQERMQHDQFQKELNQTWRDNLMHDQLLAETFNIMADFIKLN